MSTVVEHPHGSDRTPAGRSSDRWLHQETWAASRARIQKEEKQMMAQYFASHDFLLQEGANPAAVRENAASFVVNQGTGPNVVVDECMKWIEEHAPEGPFHITWYSPSALVPATLFEFRQRNPDLSAAASVHLFPGTVDIQLQAQIGTEAQEYAKQLARRQFSYMILSGHAFDLHTGDVKFHFDREIPIQKACALLNATEKFLFLDPKKFAGEGEAAYSLRDLLSTSSAVVIYTVSSPRSKEIKAAFEMLSAQLLTDDPADSDSNDLKSLRLVLVGRESVPSESTPHRGFLRRAERNESATVPKAR